jgi:conjugal transfer mating pair stabilization protein TraG
MSRRLLRLCFFLLISLLSKPAWAIDLDYEVYGGFETIRDAFEIIKGVVNNPDFDGWVFVVAVIGFALSSIGTYITSSGNPEATGKAIMRSIFAAALVLGLVNTQGRIFLYDPTKNTTAVITNVPNVVVLAAGVPNMFERGLVAMYDAISIHGFHAFADEGPGISWKALYAATSDFQPFNDENVFKSVKSYYSECMPIALTNTASGTDINLLKKGSNTTDLLAEFAKAGTSSSVYSTLYTAAQPSGIPVTCAAAWASISASMAAPGQFSRYNNSLCSKLNFNVNDAAQLFQCNARLDNLLIDYLGRTSGDRTVLAQNAGLAAAMGSAMLDEDPDLAVRGEINRAITGDGINNLIGWRDWGVIFRYGAMGFSLLALPIMMLFLFTPAMSRVLAGILALFTFNALWGVLDVAAFHFVYDHYERALESLRSYNLGFDMFQMAPDEAMKALSTLGSARFATMSLAGYLSVQIFQLSGSAFTQLGNSFGGKLDSATDRGNEIATNPAARLNTAENMFAATGGFAAAKQFGAERLGGAIGLGSEYNFGSKVGQGALMKAFGAEKGMSAGSLGEVGGGMSIAGTMGAAQGKADVAGGFTAEKIAGATFSSERTASAQETARREGLSNYLASQGLTPGQAGLMRGKLDAAVGVNQDAYRLEGIQSLSDMMKTTDRYSSLTDDARNQKAAQIWAGANAMNEKALANMGATLGMKRSEDLTTAAMTIDKGTTQGQLDGARSAGISAFTQGQRDGRERAVGTNATFSAYGGDYGRMSADKITQTQAQMGDASGLRAAASMAGMSVEQLSGQVSQWQQIANLGSADWRESAIASLLPATGGNVRAAADMLARFENLGVTSGIMATGGNAGALEVMGAADIIGNQANRDMLIGALGLPQGDYAKLARMMTDGGTLNLSPDELKAAHARNPELFDKSLVDFASANGGATVGFRMASDGTPVAMNVSSDRSTSVDHSTTADTAAFAGSATMRDALLSPSAAGSQYLQEQFMKPMLEARELQSTPQYHQMVEQVAELLSGQGFEISHAGSAGRTREQGVSGSVSGNTSGNSSGVSGTASYDARSTYSVSNESEVSINQRYQNAREIVEKAALDGYREADRAKAPEIMQRSLSEAVRERMIDNSGQAEEAGDRIKEDAKDASLTPW